MDEAYTWVEDPTMCKIGVAGCITVVTGSAPDDVLAAFGADIEPAAHPWEYSWDSEDRTVAVTTLDEAVVPVENNGYEGSRPEVLKIASRAGRAASAFWNVNGSMWGGLAESGRLLCKFDPRDLDDPPRRWGEKPDTLPPLWAEAAERVWDRDPVGMAMVVAERFTGVALTPEIVNGLDVMKERDAASA